MKINEARVRGECFFSRQSEIKNKYKNHHPKNKKLSQNSLGRGWTNVRVRSSYVTGRASTNMGWVRFTYCRGPVLIEEAPPLGVCVSPCQIKQKSFDEDLLKNRN